MSVTSTSQLSQFWTVFRLFNKYYWKTFFGPFFNVAFPMLIYGILGGLMGWGAMLSRTMAMIGLSIGIQIIPSTIVSLKKSVLLKRIGASPVKSRIFTLVVWSFFFAVLIFSSVWLGLFALLTSMDPNIYDSLSTTKGALGFLQGLLTNTVISISLGFIIASFVKNEIQAQVIGLSIFLPSAFLSGQFIAPEKIASSQGLQLISRILPFRYSTMMMNESYGGDINIPGILESEANIWSIHKYLALASTINFSYEEIELLLQQSNNIDLALQAKLEAAKIILYDETDHIISFIYPYLSIIIFLTLGIKNFRWSPNR